MKKIYFSLAVILTSTVSMAQQSSKLLSKQRTLENVKAIKSVTPSMDKASVIWMNDFSNPSDWTLTNTSSPSQNWVITTDPTLIPVPALAPANFTTVSNGYALIDSDGAGATATQNADLTADTLLDLTTISSVGLRFQQSYRTFEDRRVAEVSNDGGMTWTDFVITEGVNAEANQNTLNPEVLTLNISSVAANQDSVMIRFHYEGNFGWYWAIDDVTVIELDPYDLKAIDTYGSDDTDFEYSQLPLSQTRPISFGLIIKNVGGDTITGAGFDYDINDGSSSVETGTFGNDTLPSIATDTIYGESTFTPSALGTYTTTLTAKGDSADADLSDNTLSRTMQVTNFIWALDYGNDGSEISQPNAVDIDSTDVFKMGNQFFSQAQDTIWSVDVQLGTSQLSVGNEFFIEIREFDGANWFEVSTSLGHVVTANEPGSIINIDLQDEVILEPGTQIVILACHFGGSFNERVYFARSGEVAEGTVLFADPSDDGLTRFGGKQQAMRVRANLDRFSNNVSISEEDLSLSLEQNMPNPAKENTVVSYSLINNAEVTLKITDLNGKVIMTYNQGNQVKGTHVINVDTRQMAQGVYQYTLTAGTKSATKSMVVVK